MTTQKLVRLSFNGFLGMMMIVSLLGLWGVSSLQASGVGLWEYQNPFPQTGTLNAVWGSSANDVYAVGAAGVILHFNGTSCTEMNSGTAETLYDVWGNSGSDVYVCGDDGVILHYDGNGAGNWTQMISTSTSLLRTIWGGSSTNVFVAGSNNAFLKYDGNADGLWTSLEVGSNNEYSGIWGSGNDIYAVGACMIVMYSGDGGINWSQVDLGSDITGDINAYAYLYDIWGSSLSDIYIGGYDFNSFSGFVLHYDGTDWSKVYSQNNNGCYCIWGSSADNVFFGSVSQIWHYDGTLSEPQRWQAGSGLEAELVNNYLYGIWGSSESDIYAVGGGGTVIHSTDNGASWNSLLYGTTTTTLNDVWGVTANQLYCAGDNGVLLQTSDGGENWSYMDNTTFSTNDIKAIWGQSTNNLFIGGSEGVILQYNGANWTSRHSQSGIEINGLWGNSAGTDIFAVGDSDTLLNSVNGGQTWTPMDSGLTTDDTYIAYQNVWGSSATDVYAVGYNDAPDINYPFILHYNGTTWAQVSLSSVTNNFEYARFYDVWGSSSSNVFVTGSNSLILHYDGTDWSYMPGGNTNKSLRALWGDSSTNIFAAGSDCLHYNGTAWTRVPTGSGLSINSLWGSSFENLFGVGAYGTIIHGLNNSRSIPTGGTETLDCTDGSVYVQMKAGASAFFSAVQTAGSLGGSANGFNNELSVTTNAADGDFLALIKYHYSEAEFQWLKGEYALSESDLRLYYYDPNESGWFTAVTGNTAGTEQWMGVSAPPATPLSTADLGKHGVDTTNNYLWAVVDHATEYKGDFRALPLMFVVRNMSLLDSGYTWDFGTVENGEYAEVTFEIYNMGEGDLEIELPLTLSGSDAGRFSVTAEPDSTLSCWNSTSFTVRYDPGSDNVQSATLVIKSNDVVTGSFEINLTGQGHLIRSVGGEIQATETGIPAWPVILLGLAAAGVSAAVILRKRNLV